MFAVIKTGGKQYRVTEDDVITVERLDAKPGDTIAFSEVLMIGEGASAQIGTPMLAGATVSGEVLGQIRGPKIIVFKKKRRHNYRRKNGHRQLLTDIRITEIADGGKKKAQGRTAATGEPAPDAEAGKTE